MPDPASRPEEIAENRALRVGMVGNLFMGACGVLAAALSNSQALLLDGLFSLIGFFAAFVALRISRKVAAGPDRLRPMGYAVDETIFTTFRSLSLLVLVCVASVYAITSILAYLDGTQPPPLQYEPMVVYFAIVGLTCAALWFFHYSAWRKGGRRSEILHLEAKAAAFDTLITASAAGGLLAIAFFKDGPLSGIAPIGDSIVVLALCCVATTSYISDFRSSLGELAGVTAAPDKIAIARRTVRAQVQQAGLRIVDLTVMKLGRSFLVVIYVDTGAPVTAADVDKLTATLEPALGEALGRTDLFIVPSQYGRAFPAPLPTRAAT
ncbi:putative Co/Zn/Cd cation transporter (cation efflux family) [Aliiruegeria haliotis]|uniref:Putative Co/Zn/Cd cation transporter (Cation efflux family) n=1 Tax=Aliiruegeria haliotis TaxID=1280846 RepID=A0A2T0RWC1_9RHOB|nr:cation transporter [Aliiruegeria haliotis]PRY25471.1 putative Co/Zn/Cd cation transporter (cation efflux family) [Aliiruegeria haliotis]